MTMLSQAISVLEDNLDIRIECIEKYCRHSVAYQKNAADTLPVICILKFSLTDNTASTLSLQMQPNKLSNTLKELRSLALLSDKDCVRNVTEALLCICTDTSNHPLLQVYHTSLYTGWLKHKSFWIYLTSGYGIGSNGIEKNYFSDAASGYLIYDSSLREQEAYIQCMELLQEQPDELIPIFALGLLSILEPLKKNFLNFSSPGGLISGKTQTGKTELATRIARFLTDSSGNLQNFFILQDSLKNFEKNFGDILIKRKTISSTNYPDLIDKLYEHYFGIQKISFEDFFEIWMDWREKETSVTPKTRKENRFIWNSLLKDTELAKQPLKEIQVLDYINFFRHITKDRTLTRKRFNDMKSILNGMLYLAVEKGIISHNCLNDINYKQFAYKVEQNNCRPYTEAEREQIIKYLSGKDDFYSMAILLDFYLVLRIGELKGLKWSDISNGYIHISRFVNDKNEVVNEIKGHTSEGIRTMPLTPGAQAVLEKIYRLHFNSSDYIFFRDGKPLATVTFNRHLKKCCEELNIEYRSSHKLRFSTASIMYKNGVSDTELQKLLGHTTLTMTQHYLKNIVSEQETANKMAAILG